MFNKLLKLADDCDREGNMSVANQIQDIIKKIAEGDDVLAEAKKVYREGYDLYYKGDYKNARIKFSIGYQLTQKPTFLFNMANCSLKMGDRDKAQIYFEQYLNSGGKKHAAAIAKFLGNFSGYEPEISKLTNQISNSLKRNQKIPDVPIIRDFLEKLFA